MYITGPSDCRRDVFSTPAQKNFRYFRCDDSNFSNGVDVECVDGGKPFNKPLLLSIELSRNISQILRVSVFCHAFLPPQKSNPFTKDLKLLLGIMIMFNEKHVHLIYLYT